MNIAYIISAIVMVLPTLILGYANGITFLFGGITILLFIALMRRKRGGA